MTPVLEQPMRFKAFCREIDFNEDDFYREIFLQHPFQIQNQRIAVKRLKHICNATFYLANKSGFSAMTLRQLSEQSGMSMGGLYAYISSKEELAHFIYSSLNHYCQKQIQAFDIEQESIASRLNMIIRCHLYLSELLHPWFYFAYMEARNLDTQKKMAIASEQIMEDKLARYIRRGIDIGEFEITVTSTKTIRLVASLIKSMLQDWYLKRGKYQKRKVSVDQYANELIAMTMSHLGAHEQEMVAV